MNGAEFSTSICLEEPLSENAFVARERSIYGYSVDALWSRCSLAQVIFLLFAGELPTAEQGRLFERLLIGLANLGPRDVGVRAAMIAGITKTQPEHLLPIGLLSASGEVNGSAEVVPAVRFVRAHLQHDPAAVVLARARDGLQPTDTPFPGFGSSYGSPDPVLARLATACLKAAPHAPALGWCSALVSSLRVHGHGWRVSGLVAAVGLDLGLGERECIAVAQLARAPGIAAHGLEQSHQPIHEARLLSDQHYERRDPT